MTPLLTYSSGRDNNFNLLRLVAASLVLVSHSFALSTGKPELEPFRSVMSGLSLGNIAVDVFFVASGFLVAGSLLTRRDILNFFAARALRIYPGLWVALVLTVLAVGLWFTSLDFAAYITHRETWRYLAKNALMLHGVSYRLPGAFGDVPYPWAVNGSLWTLPYELKMYGLLGLSWITLKAARQDSARALGVVCVAIALLAVSSDIVMFLIHRENLFVGLLAKFFTGAALRALHRHVPASAALFWGLLAVLCLSATNATCFGVTYRLVVAYLVIYAALVPAGPIRMFNRMGDYSYGIYIYAFPVQQAVAHLWQGVKPLEMLAASFGITFGIAFVSWHLVEERSLSLKSRLIRGQSRDARVPPTAVAASE